MKKLSKLLALMLAVIMTLSVMPVSFAAEVEKCPTIYIPGIASSKIYSDVNDSSSLFEFPSIEVLTKRVENEVVPALIVYAADKDADKLAGVISDLFNYIFEGWFNNPDGSAKGNSGAILRYPSAASINENSIITFDWDWRGDPVEVAEKLNVFINYVTVNSKFNKVALASHSLGSTVILSYLSKYGSDKITGIVYDTPVIDGVNYVGELLLGNMETDGDAIVATVKSLLGSSENADVINNLMDILTLAGLTGEFAGLFNSVIDEIAPVLYRDTLVPLFARWVTVWAMTPAEDVDTAADYIFTKYLTDEESQVLKSKVERYNNLVRENRYETLRNFDANGRFAVISRYGYSSLPITQKWSEASDNVVETSRSSLGATTAVVGDFFSDEYIASKNAKYISPDKTIDASTCFVPEKTWFIKGLDHAKTTVTRSYYSALLFGAEEATCDNFVLSRFTAYDAESESIVADESVPVKTEKKTAFQVLIDFIRNFFKKLLSFFGK